MRIASSFNLKSPSFFEPFRRSAEVCIGWQVKTTRGPCSSQKWQNAIIACIVYCPVANHKRFRLIRMHKRILCVICFHVSIDMSQVTLLGSGNFYSERVLNTDVSPYSGHVLPCFGNLKEYLCHNSSRKLRSAFCQALSLWFGPLFTSWESSSIWL